MVRNPIPRQGGKTNQSCIHIQRLPFNWPTRLAPGTEPALCNGTLSKTLLLPRELPQVCLSFREGHDCSWGFPQSEPKTECTYRLYWILLLILLYTLLRKCALYSLHYIITLLLIIKLCSWIADTIIHCSSCITYTVTQMSPYISIWETEERYLHDHTIGVGCISRAPLGC